MAMLCSCLFRLLWFISPYQSIWWCTRHHPLNSAGRVYMRLCRFVFFLVCCFGLRFVWYVWWLLLFGHFCLVLLIWYGIEATPLDCVSGPTLARLFWPLFAQDGWHNLPFALINKLHATACWSTWRKLRGDGRKKKVRTCAPVLKIRSQTKA